jgi:Dolichyl-phosphate-mannose-protein mannosyltransferase
LNSIDRAIAAPKQTAATTMNQPSTELPALEDRTVQRVEPGRLEAWFIRNSQWVALAFTAVGLVVRITYARSCYLNPDEAQHFDAARFNTWYQVFLASHRLSHPPLFIFVLHAVLFLGRSEPFVRLPSLAGGTAALWLTFAWIRRSLGAIPALIGLLFMAVSPAAISASTEARQYGLLLFFLCGALYTCERMFAERSLRWALFHGLFLLGALLSHFTALVIICSIDLYVLLRCILDRMPRRMVWILLANQVLLAGVFAWLYLSYVHNAQVLNSQSMSYLRNLYYMPGQETVLHFSKRAILSTFSYLVSQRLAIRSLTLAYFAAVITLLVSRNKTTRLLAVLILATFLTGFVGAVCQVFPFAGSRHQTYLLPFLAIGFAALCRWVPARFSPVLVVVAMALSPTWLIRNLPDNNRSIMPIEDERSAVDYIHRTVPPGAPLFMDDATWYVFSYYLGRNDPALDMDANRAKRSVDGHLMISPRSFGWILKAPNAVDQVNEAAKALAPPTAGSLWIVSDTWPDPALGPRLPAARVQTMQAFGEISVIEVKHQ